MAKPKLSSKSAKSTSVHNPPGSLRVGGASSTRKEKAKGIKPSDPKWGITNTSRSHSSAVTQSSGRNTPSAQGTLASKAKRQVG